MIELNEETLNELLEKHPFRVFARKCFLAYPSIQKTAYRMLKRKRGSYYTFDRYLQGVDKFVKYLKVDDSEEALKRLKKGDAQ